MHSNAHSTEFLFAALWQAAALVLTLLLVLALMLIFAQPAQAQTYTVIHNFAGWDGSAPWAGVTIDGTGNLYGTTVYGGGYGEVFKLGHTGSRWIFSEIYGFSGSPDGMNPWGGVTFGPDGTLYGTTVYGGTGQNGTIFNLRPPATICKAVLCPWTETVIYSFTGRSDGGNPYLNGDLIFDQTGNGYGTTGQGGAGNGGVVYELTPSGSGWMESVLYAFGEGSDPLGGLVMDKAGNLYGTTGLGGQWGSGAVFELTYSAGRGWTENVLYNFQGGNDGEGPFGLVFDSSGNLYGTTIDGGQGGGGTVFELMPSGGGWKYALVYSFTGIGGQECGPWGPLAIDVAGNLYGATVCDGANKDGNVFKLTPSGGVWTYTPLHDFVGQDGFYPHGNVIVDSHGNLYGTTSQGGAYGYGVVWEITP